MTQEEVLEDFPRIRLQPGLFDVVIARQKATGELCRYCPCVRSYPVFMKGITIKLPEMTLRQLRQEARATGRSVAEIVRDCLENRSDHGARSVYALSSDLAGSVSGGRKSATNKRRRFRRT